MDVVPGDRLRYGFPNISDNAEIVGRVVSKGVIFFMTARGSVAGSAITLAIRICANPAANIRLQEGLAARKPNRRNSAMPNLP